jgi:hypothetical protein
VKKFISHTFTKSLVDRGVILLHEQQLISIEKIEDFHWLGLFRGQTNLEVEIELNEDHALKSYQCSCIYFHQNHECRHITAMIEHMNTQLDISDILQTNTSNPKSIFHLLENIQAKSLNRFLRKYARMDKKFAEALKVFLVEHSDPLENRNKYDALLTSIIKSKKNRVGQYSSRTISQIENQLLELIQKATIKWRENEGVEAFHISMALIKYGESFLRTFSPLYDPWQVDFFVLKKIILSLKKTAISPEFKEDMATHMDTYINSTQFGTHISNIAWLDNNLTLVNQNPDPEDQNLYLAELIQRIENDPAGIFDYSKDQVFQWTLLVFYSNNQSFCHRLGQWTSTAQFTFVKKVLDGFLKIIEFQELTEGSKAWLIGFFTSDKNVLDKFEYLLARTSDAALLHFMNVEILPNLKVADTSLKSFWSVVDQYLGKEGILNTWRSMSRIEIIELLIGSHSLQESDLTSLHLELLIEENLTGYFGQAPLDRLKRIFGILEQKNWHGTKSQWVQYLLPKMTSKQTIKQYLVQENMIKSKNY